MDMDNILSKGDFSLPVLADFILGKYEAIRDTDPEGARKIEEQVFSQQFLASVLDAKGGVLKNQALGLVPHACFTPLADKVERIYLETEALGVRENARKVLASVAPQRLAAAVENRCRRQLEQHPCSGENFYGLADIGELPSPATQEIFTAFMDLFKKNVGELSNFPAYGELLRNLLYWAIELEDPEAIGIAILYIKHLADQFETADEERRGRFSYDLFYGLAPKVGGEEEDFELDLYFDEEEGWAEPRTAMMDLIYGTDSKAPSILSSFEEMVEKRDEKDPLSRLVSFPKASFRDRIIRELARNPEVADCLTAAGLAYPAAGVFNALLWQLQRNDGFNPGDLTDDELAQGLKMDQRPLPFWDRIKTYMGTLPEDRREKILHEALQGPLTAWEEFAGKLSALENILELMAKFKLPGCLPLLINTLRWDPDYVDDEFNEIMIPAIASFKDEIFEYLPTLMEHVADMAEGDELEGDFSTILLDLLEILRRVATPKAEAFIMDHWALFEMISRADVLDTCRSLLSRRALDLVAHKKGKGQPDIDKFYVTVKLLEGEDNPEIQKLLEQINTEDKILATLNERISDNSPRRVLDLELCCENCGDKNYYECRDIILSPKGDAYVAEELTCINCERLSGFELSQRGWFVVNAEVMRRMAVQTDPDSLPDMGAIRLMNTAVMGRPMSIPEGISLYRHQIEKQPSSAEPHIGLGNIFRACDQNRFAAEQFQFAIEKGPLYFESYLALAVMADEEGKRDQALAWLEKGRPFLRRPLVVKGMESTPEELMDAYIGLHSRLIVETGSDVSRIKEDECMARGLSFKKIGPNEKCPCGSGKKYKKCCMKKR